MKKYIVELTAEERSQLKGCIQAQRMVAHKRHHARMLLKLDQGLEGPGWSDAKGRRAAPPAFGGAWFPGRVGARQSWISQSPQIGRGGRGSLNRVGVRRVSGGAETLDGSLAGRSDGGVGLRGFLREVYGA